MGWNGKDCILIPMSVVSRILVDIMACHWTGNNDDQDISIHAGFLPNCWPHYNPLSMKLKGGYTDFTCSVCLSVRLSMPPSICPSVDRIVSALYLQQYLLDPFHICTSYQVTSESASHVMLVSKLIKLKFWQILKICNFGFVFFWLGIQYESIVRVTMRRWWVSSECGHSSY